MLLSDRDRAVVDRTLLNLRLKAREAQRSRASTYCSSALACWNGRTSAGRGFASILIPSELRRSGPLQLYRVAAIDDGAVVNPILAHRLRTEYGLELPTMPAEQTADSVDAVMKQVGRGRPGRMDRDHW